MFPVLFEIGSIPINAYGFMIMVGFLAAVWVAVRRGRTLGISSDMIMDVGIYSMIMGLLGAKLNHILQYPGTYKASFRAMTDFSQSKLWILGIVVGVIVPFLVVRSFQVKKGTPSRAFALKFLILYLICAAIGGCSTNMVVHHFKYLKDWTSGFVFYGGVITGVITGALIVRQKGQSILRMGDLAAPCIMLGLAFGRVGCFLFGCCYGFRTDLPVGVSFPVESPPYRDHLSHGWIQPGVESLPVHPTQLYETLAAMAIFMILSSRWDKRKVEGEVLAWLGICYPIWRFFVEFLRGDNEKFWFGLITFSQGISLLVFFASLWWLSRLRKFGSSAAETVPPPVKT